MSITRWTRRRMPTVLLPIIVLAAVLNTSGASWWWWAVWAVIAAWTVYELAVGEHDERRRSPRSV